MSNYQSTGTQMMPLVDYSALSQQSLTAIQQYMDQQGQEAVLDIISNQRAVRVGYHAAVGYAALLQTTSQAKYDFPDMAGDFEEIEAAVLRRLCDNISGNRR